MNSQEIQAADYSFAATRVESRIPAGYRLICVSGELKLQGLFTWTQGRDSGREWRTLETQYVETELTLDEFIPF